MKNLLNCAALFSLLLFASCGNDEESIDPILDRIESSNQEEEIESEEELIEYVPADVPVFAMNGLDFGQAGYIVSIDSMDIMDYKGDVIIPKNDTCSFFLDLGEHVLNCPLRISPTKQDEFLSFEVFQRALFHFSVSNEGPHCDLIEEEPYYSEWTELRINKPNYSFQTLKWDDIQTPKVEMSDEEFKALVLEHCTERYADLLGNEYISASSNDHLATSGYEIKIIATRADGSVKTSYIYLSSPMGC